MLKCIANKPLTVVIFWTGTPSNFGRGEGVHFFAFHAKINMRSGNAMKTKGFMSQIFEIRKDFETMNDNFIKRDKDISKEINTKKKQFIVNKNEFEKKWESIRRK